MSELIFGYDEELSKWVSRRIPHVGEQGFGPCSAIGVASNGKLLAGIIYHDYQPNLGTIQLSMAADSPLWARRSTIAALLNYPFRQIGVFKVWTAIPLDNVLAIKVNEHIGFKREAVLAHHFGRKRHCAVMRMLEPDYVRLFEKERVS